MKKHFLFAALFSAVLSMSACASDTPAQAPAKAPAQAQTQTPVSAPAPAPAAASPATPAPRNLRITAKFDYQKPGPTVTITVPEGGEGRIVIGEKLPHVGYYQYYLSVTGKLSRDEIDTMKEVSTAYFVVNPHIVDGDFIEMNMIPELSYRTADGPNKLLIREATQTWRVKDGVPAEIGGVHVRSEFEATFLRNRQGYTATVTLTADILKQEQK